MEKNYDLNLASVPNELKLILEIISIEDVESIQMCIKERFTDIDWELLIELAMHHRLYPVLYGKLKQIDSHLIPQDILQSLNQLYKTNTFRMLHLSGELEQICKAFNEYDIKTITLKGPVLAVDLYGDLSLRTSSDLDILIPITELDSADQLLMELGFEKEEDNQKVFNDWKWRNNHITYFHQQKGVKCEIHWRLYPFPGKEPSFNELWSRKRSSSLTSYPIYYLGSEDLLLYLVFHGARHGWSRLRWLTDIDKLLKQKINWKFLYELMDRYYSNHLVGHAIILSSQLFKTNITKEMQLLTCRKKSIRLARNTVFYFEKMINLHTDSLPREIDMYHIRYLFSILPFSKKLLVAVSILYPSTSDIKTLTLPKYLYFLYFPLHPFLWIWRKTRMRKLS